MATIRRFGQPLILTSDPIVYDGDGRATVRIELPRHEQVMIVGMRAVGATLGGEATRVTALRYADFNRVMGDVGVPLSHIAQPVGDGFRPMWRGRRGEIAKVLRRAAARAVAANPRLNGSSQPVAFARAMQTATALCGDGLECAAIVGGGIDRSAFEVELADLTHDGGERLSRLALVAIQIGHMTRAQGLDRDGLHNSPLWFGQRTAVSPTAPFELRDSMSMPVAGMDLGLVLAARATAWRDDGDQLWGAVPAAQDDIVVTTLPETPGPGSFANHRAPLRIAADGVASMERAIGEGAAIGWLGQHTGATTHLHVAITTQMAAINTELLRQPH